MKKLTTLLICAIGMCAASCTGEDRPITVDQLPATAHQFLTQHFDMTTISHITEQTEIFSKEYDACFVTGDKVEFGGNGAWTSVDCEYSAVPVGVVPTPIGIYLQEKFPTAVVLKIKHHKKSWEVKLNNHMELKFNKEFQLVELDD